MEKPVLPQVVSFFLFLSLYLLGVLIALLLSPFSSRARLALAGFWTFVKVSIQEMKSGKSEKVNVLQCRLSGRIIDFSPRLAGFLYRNFLPISAGLFSIGVLVFVLSGLWVVTLMFIIFGVFLLPWLSKKDDRIFIRKPVTHE